MKKITFLLLLIYALFSQTAMAHNETVATLSFSNANDVIYLQVTVEKRHLVLALEKEGTCTPDKMFKVCGDTYFNDNILIFVNGQSLELDKQSVDVQKDFVIYNYKIKSYIGKLESVIVKSSYMLKYNDHSRTKLVFEEDDELTSYFLHINRSKIKHTYKS